MRLGDLDALYDRIEERYKNTGGEEHKVLREILNDICDAPTIDAIPVEWLEKQADYARSEWDYDTCEGVRIALKEWQTEQEVRT